MSRNSKNDSKGSTLKTIRCHLDASEDVLRKVWEEMTQKNTPLIIQLLKSVSEQSEFETNKQNGNITNKEITKLRKSITKDSELEEQSGRLGSSADSFVKEVYSAWLTLYQKREKQKEGKEYFLNNILKSDVELVEESNCDLQTIRYKAQEILSQPKKILEQINNNKKKTKSSPRRSKKNSEKENSIPKQDADKNIPKTLNKILHDIHRNTQEVVIRCAVSYLLKNYNKVSEVEEDIKKLEKRRTEKKVQIRRLEKQIQNNRLPNGRDITGEIYNEALDNLINQVPKDNEEYKEWIDNISKKISYLPYPIHYLYSDMTGCYKNEKGHIFVYFNGWANYHFKICCNQRQRHFFERFLEDHKAFTKNEKGKEKLSGSLSTLRSIKLLWQQGEGKGEPWKVHKLALHCTYDTHLWTAEGTEEVRKEKTAQVQKLVSEAEDNKNKSLDEQEPKNLKANQSSLSRLNNSFTRPSKPAYQGQSNIIVGISFHPVELATVAIIDTNTKKVLVCKTVKQLLGSAFNLLSRRRRQQVHLRKEREKAQKKDSPCNMGESELGEYVDKLLAKRIVETAKSYQASCIVLPTLKDIREIRTSAIQAKAETKIPGDVNGQKLYVKEYNRQIHNWSYNRLQESITSKSAELKISIEFGIQPHYGTLQEQARDLAFYAYQCRINTISK